MPESRSPIVELVRGDITTQAVDAVLNAASPHMRGGGGVDGAIHRAGGPAVLRGCVERFPHGLEVGRAGWTVAGDLPARWVIHVVGPNRHAGQTDPDLLVSCYREALAVADGLGARTLAAPLVSAGVYGWPLDEAARIAVQTVRAARTDVEVVRFVAFGADAEAVLATHL